MIKRTSMLIFILLMVVQYFGSVFFILNEELVR